MGTRGFNVLSNLAARVKGGRDKPGARAHARGANTPGAPHTNTDVHHVLMIWPTLEHQQSEFGDGFGARFVGLQGRPGLKTNKASFMRDLAHTIWMLRQLSGITWGRR